MNEMHDPVMGPAESENLQFIVGVTDEVPVGEEQKLDRTAQQGLVRGGRARRPAGGGAETAGFGNYVSHVDVFSHFC